MGAVGNSFTADRFGAELYLSNGGTSVLYDVLALAGSALAVRPWQQHLTLYFCEWERYDSGCSGFDLDDLPWTADHVDERAFFLRLLDLAATRHGWDLLTYDPPHAADYVAKFRDMVDGFTPRPTAASTMGDWSTPPPPHEVDRCVRHGVFQGEQECRLCDCYRQPVDAPKVWQLSSRDARHRTFAQIPDAAVPRLRELFDFGVSSARHTIDPARRPLVEAILGIPLDPAMDHVVRLAVAVPRR